MVGCPAARDVRRDDVATCPNARGDGLLTWSSLACAAVRKRDFFLPELTSGAARLAGAAMPGQVEVRGGPWGPLTFAVL